MMRGLFWSILAIGTIFIALPAQAIGRYDSNYAVCREVYGADGGYIECTYTSIEQCKGSQSGMGGDCFNNPTYVAPPPAPEEAAPAPPPAPVPAASKKARRPPAPATPKGNGTSG
jgi:hypothetical protein